MKPTVQGEDIREQELHWVQQALAGDTEAFVQLIEIYQRSVYNLCYRILGNAEDAEDAAQETFFAGISFLAQIRSTAIVCYLAAFDCGAPLHRSNSQAQNDRFFFGG
jgi:hypothetical protein